MKTECSAKLQVQHEQPSRQMQPLLLEKTHGGAWQSDNLIVAFSTCCAASSGNNRLRGTDLQDFLKHLLLKDQVHELPRGCWQLHRQ